MEENRRAAKAALKVCQEKINQHELEMKLVDAEYTFDRNKIIFYFTADGRVDFRELVRDLAAVFRTRIELRQIGVRDEAKMLGGIGPCGRVLCCSSFLGDFEPVSIKMAKDQNLSLNPTKISGLCGRLMCCLKYENDIYEEAKQLLPDIGERISTPDGEGRVVALNLLERRVQVELRETGAVVEHLLHNVKGKRSPQASRV
jgi:cell fate regulator YaaT (PSP1 superfamily)